MELFIVRLLFMLLSFFGFLLMIFGIPGNFISMGIGILYYFISPGRVSTGQLIALIALAVSGEVVENIVSLVGAKKYGASKMGMLGAFLGSIFGGIIGSMILPIIGTFLGVFAGAFLLTFLFEYRLEGKSTMDAERAGYGALIGKVLAVSYKYSCGVVLLVLLGFILF
jgi:uncharacterized protein YqgC (DUF456 family)